jgi:hypothetical protein
MPDMPDDMVCVLPWCIGGGIDEDVMVWERPGGGAAPKMLEKAASL